MPARQPLPKAIIARPMPARQPPPKAITARPLPCPQYGKFAEAMGEGGCCCQCLLYWLAHMFCLQGLVAGPKRAKLRGAHGLPPAPCGDCCIHTWCSPLAVCQEMRVVKK